MDGIYDELEIKRKAISRLNEELAIEKMKLEEDKERLKQKEEQMIKFFEEKNKEIEMKNMEIEKIKESFSEIVFTWDIPSDINENDDNNTKREKRFKQIIKGNRLRRKLFGYKRNGKFINGILFKNNNGRIDNSGHCHKLGDSIFSISKVESDLIPDIIKAFKECEVEGRVLNLVKNAWISDYIIK